MTLEEQLARVEWSRLKHAYGSADDLPEIILRRASRDEAVAGAASTELWGTVWHQGTVYEASAAAIPALATLARNPVTVDRLDVLLLLSSMATGDSYAKVHGSGTAEGLAEELTWVRDTRRAIAEAASALFQAFGTAGRDVQLNLAVLATAVPRAQGVTHVRALAHGFEAAPTAEARQVFAVSLLALGTRDVPYTLECGLIESDEHIGDHVDAQDLALLHGLLRGESTDGRGIVRLLSDLVARAESVGTDAT